MFLTPAILNVEFKSGIAVRVSVTHATYMGVHVCMYAYTHKYMFDIFVCK